MAIINNPDERNDPPKPLLEHLLALRDMFIYAATSWVLCAIVAGVCTPWIRQWLVDPAERYKDMIQGLDLTSGFSIILAIAIWGGTALAFPFIVYALLRFIFPALTRREKFVMMTVLTLGTFLFLGGACLAYAQTLPLVVNAFQAINNWTGLPVTTIRVEGYISIVLKTIIAFGLVFQLPLIIVVLGCFGILSSQTLREKRRLAIVMCFVLAMFLTPPDPMSQLIMAIPMCLLYELSIWIVWLKEKGTIKL